MSLAEDEDIQPGPVRSRKKIAKPFRVDEKWLNAGTHSDEWFKRNSAWMFDWRERSRFRTLEEAEKYVKKLEREALSHRRDRRIVNESEDGDE